MKWKLHSAALVAAINLALTSSVLAMPTGGVVASGNVTGLDNGTVANGGTIATAGGPAVINWGAFSLLKGESLTVNTVNGALLNRVTGTQLSELRGFLTQTGAHPMLLINPNGIIVGGTASINAQSLILSTLNMTNDAFKAANVAPNNGAVFTGDKAANKIQVDSGAQLNISELLQMFGGTVNVADNVTFSVPDGNSDKNLNIALGAGGQISATYGGSSAQDNHVLVNNAAKDNTVTVGALAKPLGNSGRTARIDLAGGAVSLNGTVIKVDDVKDAPSIDSGVYLVAANKADFDGAKMTVI